MGLIAQESVSPETFKLSAFAIQNSILPQFQSITNDNLYIFDEIDSTNTNAKKRAQDVSHTLHGTVILAEKQTAGRGRLGRSFFSPSLSGLYMSVLYKVQNLDPMLITALSAVAVTRAIREVYSINTQIKWVNDVFLDGKKICGILTEGIFNLKSRTIDTVVIGIGINVYSENFPQDLHQAGSLSHTKQVNHDEDFYKSSRNILCASILNNLFSILSSNNKTIESCIEEYKQLSFLITKEVTVIKGNETFKAKVVNITKQAHLLIEKEDGTQEELLSGEVSIKI